MTGYQKRFLDPRQLESAAAEVGALAEHEGVRVALIGGFALQHYGSDRLTGNIDFAAERLLDGLPGGPPLSFGGVQTTSPSGVPVHLGPYAAQELDRLVDEVEWKRHRDEK